MTELALKIENVSKQYQLGAIGGTTFREEFSRWINILKNKLSKGQNNIRKKEYFMALEDISFEVKKGERVGIIGHNGAGKSTLLKLLSRVTSPSSGKISYNGKISSMLEVGTGFHGELTGRENIYMNGAILGMTKREIDSKIDDIISFAEMEQFIDTPVKRYSSGMYVKLAFSVAAHLDNDILVMDEVLAVGDMKFQQKCLGKMDSVSRSEGKTVLFVSHNMNLIRQLCTRCIVLKNGRIEYDGSVEGGINHYMDSSTSLFTKYRDVSNIPRTEYPAKIAKMKSFELMNNNLFIETGEKLELKICINSKRNMNHVFCRIYCKDMLGTAVGIYSSENEVDITEGDQQFSMKLNVDMLLPGKYQLGAILYQVVCQEVTVLDVIQSGMAFDKYCVAGEFNTGITTSKHGHCNLGNIEIAVKKLQ